MKMRGYVLMLCVSLLGCVGQQARTPPDVKTTTAYQSDGARGGVAWVKFVDPFEKAFTLDAPRGWTAKGGLFRLGFSDVRPMVDLRSPDGGTNIRIGDVGIPSYAVPNQYHTREGEVYDLGAQAQMVVAKYRSGPEFAVLYSNVRFRSICHDPKADQADTDFAIQDYLPAGAKATETSAGKIAYRCDADGGPKVAFVSARTALYGTLWQVPALVSFIASTAQVSFARRVIVHSLKTFKVNPQWVAYQQRMDAQGLAYQRARQQQRLIALSEQVQQFEAQMRAMQNQVSAFERRQAAQTAQVEGFTNILVGITPTSDPLTGENRQVWTGTKSGYWVNGLGQVVNSDVVPGAGWRQLQTH